MLCRALVRGGDEDEVYVRTISGIVGEPASTVHLFACLSLGGGACTL
jgi:hypothetical protein